MGTDGPARRRQIEDTTAARLAEIVAAAEQAAKRVIDEAEAEARARLADADQEADRIVAERLAGLVALTEDIGAQAEELRRGAEELLRALAAARAGLGGADAPMPAPRHEGVTELGARKASSPSLTVLDGAAESPDETERTPREASPRPDRRATDEKPAAAGDAPAAAEGDSDPELSAGGNGTPAGARLLATQMAVSGSSRAEIEARLRNGFAIADTRPILDAILGPEN